MYPGGPDPGRKNRGAVFLLLDCEYYGNADVECAQVIMDCLDKNGANGAN